ncbi:patatin-like phospholipase family protein [Ruegeria sp. 2012CJ41-6]|uniref:Patatin-like phospholipase family protein n=1 Tax=Ruegeria spongiae TaxID=2942209 RepID=A0ABT0Q5P8_9RHOB|nr:patatin-like phospholipase family protein [Ruegeria spongiae]MCL6285127.1 patatin-like phospholipase family protein [Ruegeria spongiae]
MRGRGGWFRLLPALVIVLVGIGCAPKRALPPPDAATYESFEPVGMPPDIRYYADDFEVDKSQVIAEFRAAVSREKDADGVQLLALSGGGADGAYGAGVLNGWSRSGRRPEFDVVTGISTGAIIAPFAFLGSDYDPPLREFYTETRTADVAQLRILDALISGRTIANVTPLKKKINREMTDQLIREIAQEHARGRRLFVGTTNIDAERPVLWDVGAIASVGTPQAHQLVRSVILASASIPLVFDPVPIQVSNGHEVRQEMHVDGALTQQIFAYPPGLPVKQTLRELGYANKANTIWLIHNKRLEPRYREQDLRLSKMVDRTLGTLVRSQGLGDIAAITALAKRDDLRLRGLAVPVGFQTEPKEFFDPGYMRALYTQGYADGLRPDSWRADLKEIFLAR